MKATDLPDSIEEVDPTIKEMVVECEETKKPFRITPQELDFYRSHKVPLPRKHFDVRRQERMRYREVLQLYLRTCDNCHQETLSVYPQVSEFKVYCEACYDHKVY